MKLFFTYTPLVTTFLERVLYFWVCALFLATTEFSTLQVVILCEWKGKPSSRKEQEAEMTWQASIRHGIGWHRKSLKWERGCSRVFHYTVRAFIVRRSLVFCVHAKLNNSLRFFFFSYASLSLSFSPRQLPTLSIDEQLPNSKTEGVLLLPPHALA